MGTGNFGNSGGDDPNDAGYEVGYGKAPVANRFGPNNKLGKGRPKGGKNIKTVVLEALGAKIPAKINGKVKKMTKLELAMHQLANKASGGDLKAIGKVIDLQERYGPHEDPAGPAPEETRASFTILRQHLEVCDVFRDEDAGDQA